MYKKLGFTLAEILICLTIIGIMGAIFMINVKNEKFDEKATIANANKAISAIDQASMKILEIETESCPTGAFMTKPAGLSKPEYTITNASGGPADANEVLALFGKYIKFDKTNLNYCDYSPAHTVCENGTNTTIKGGKLPGSEVYIGFKVSALTTSGNLSDCGVQYYIPGAENYIPGNGYTWGWVYIDTNGKKGPDKSGKDVFYYCMGETGIAR